MRIQVTTRSLRNGFLALSILCMSANPIHSQEQFPPPSVTRTELEGVIKWEVQNNKRKRPHFFDVYSSITSLNLPDDPDQLPFGKSVAFLVGIGTYDRWDPLPGVPKTISRLRCEFRKF
jgi:hypothetical protein